jgi:uncharacterized protein YciI
VFYLRERTPPEQETDALPAIERGATLKYVLLYETAPGALPKAMKLFPDHQKHYRPFVERGELIGIGTFGDPQEEGSMAIFSSREAAEEFVERDPFTLEGVVARWTIREWDDVLDSD